MKVFDFLEPLIDESDYTIYAVRCESVTSKVRKVLFGASVVSDLLFFTGSWNFPFLQNWYLVASTTHGTLARVKGLKNPRIEETIPVPDWNPAWKHLFTEVTIDDRRFRKTAQVSSRHL